MRAIIETGGKQFAVAPNQTIRVPSLAGDPGDRVTFDHVLYAAGSDAVHVGSPHVDGASVTAEIVKHGRGRKITVFKYKRRKRYSRKKGHRQDFTELRVTDVMVGGARRSESRESAEPAASGVFVCEACGKEYKTERGLAQHTAREHGESSE